MMQNIPDDLFEKIVGYLDPHWVFDFSRNYELTAVVSELKHQTFRQRLLKCVELWWRKIHYSRLLRNRPRDLVLMARILEIPYTTIIHHEISRLWEDRCWKLREKQIHGEIDHGKWGDGNECCFPHTVSGGGPPFSLE